MIGDEVDAEKWAKLSYSEDTYVYEVSSPFKHYSLNIYEMKDFLDQMLPDMTSFPSDPAPTISQITFKQNYQESTSRSRLYDLRVYNGMSTTISGQTKNSVIVQLDFSGKDINQNAMFYRPTVKMQDTFGRYNQEVVSDITE